MGKVSDRTKELHKKKNIFCAISFCLFLGTALFFIIYAFATLDLPTSSGTVLSEEAKAQVVAISTTSAICIAGVIIIRDKFRIAVWMVTLILSVILFDKAGMFVVLGIWLVDEYVFYALYKRYKRKEEINKEIDLR